MNMKLLISFIILNIVNVTLQTAKSILTNKGNKWIAAIANAVAYGLYTVLLVYMNCDLSLAAKVITVGTCNLIGVFIVKKIEEKMQKEKLWKIELTMGRNNRVPFYNELRRENISFNFTIVDKWALFNCYCSTREESKKVMALAKNYGAKSFASESKLYGKDMK